MFFDKGKFAEDQNTRISSEYLKSELSIATHCTWSFYTRPRMHIPQTEMYTHLENARIYHLRLEDDNVLSAENYHGLRKVIFNQVQRAKT